MVYDKLFSLYFRSGILLMQLQCHRFQQTTDISKEKLTFIEAINHCSKKNERLLLPSDGHEDLLVLETRNGFWMNMIIERLESLVWTTGSKVNGRSFYKYDAKCGVINVNEMEIYEQPCINSYHSWCQIENCKDCPSGLNCFVHAANCYIFSSDKQNWYQGQTFCSSRRGRLAVFESPDQLKGISASNLPSVSLLWLGSRTIDWAVSDNSSKWIPRYKWLPGQPEYYKDCVVLTREQGQVGWKSKNCDDEAKAVCIGKRVIHEKLNPAVVNGDETNTSNSQTKSGTSQTNNESIIQGACSEDLKTQNTPTLLALLVAVSTFLVLAVVCLIYVYWTKISLKQTRNIAKTPEETPTEVNKDPAEQESLINKISVFPNSNTTNTLSKTNLATFEMNDLQEDPNSRDAK